MVQDTTAEFSHRLVQAMEGHPRAPMYGHQAWLRNLLKEAGLEVSANSVHKWARGTARPRRDAVRVLARVLAVDEVWLAMGSKKVDDTDLKEQAGSRSAATLLLAGLIELSGGKVAFPAPTDEGVSLWANIGSARIGIVAVVPQAKGKLLSFIVPDPIGDNRLVAVLVDAHSPGACDATRCVDLLDLTDLPRKDLGGFSVVQVERRAARKFKAPSQRALLEAADTIEDLAVVA